MQYRPFLALRNGRGLPSCHFYEHRLTLIAMVDELHQAVEGVAAVGDLARLGIPAHEDAALGIGRRVATVDADALVVGHADKQGQPAVEPWTHCHHHRIAAFGDGGLALHLASTVVEIHPTGLKGVTKICPRGERPTLAAADVELTDGVGRTLGNAFQLEFYHDSRN